MEDSSVGRLLGVLTAPGKTFRSIAGRPTWVAPLVFLILVSAAFWIVLLPKLDREAFRAQVRAQVEEQGQQMPPEEQLETMEKVAVGCLPAASVLGVAFYFALAGILLAATNMLGGQIGYKTSLSVTLHAFMPFALAALLAIPVALARPSVALEELQGGSLLPSNLAAFAPEETGVRMTALLSSFDLFSLWTIALLVLGFHVAGRVSKGAVAGVVIGLWALWVVAKVGLAGLGGG